MRGVRRHRGGERLLRGIPRDLLIERVVEPIARGVARARGEAGAHPVALHLVAVDVPILVVLHVPARGADRKSTRLNSSHRCISYAVFCLKKKKDTRSRETVSVQQVE